MATGEIEVLGKTIETLNPSVTPPFQLDEHSEAGEDVRLKYRYIDLRRPEMQQRLRTRARISSAVRTFLESEGCRSELESMRTFADRVGLPILAAEIGPLLQGIPDVLRSDHAAFWQANIPAVVISDSAEFRNPRYHCLEGADTADSLDYEFAMRVVKMTLGAVWTAASS